MDYPRFKNDYGLLNRDERSQARSMAWSVVLSDNMRLNRGAYAWCKARALATVIAAITGFGRGVFEAARTGDIYSGMGYFVAGFVLLAISLPFVVRLLRLRRLLNSTDLSERPFLSVIGNSKRIRRNTN